MFSRVAILLAIAAAAAAAQTPAQTSQSKWDALKTLSPGIEVRVATSSAKAIQGALDSVTDSALVIKQAGGPTSFDRAQILSVSVKGKEHRLRNVMIGLGVGTALGVAVGFGIGRARCGQGGWCDLDTGVDTAIAGIGGLVAGTLTGVFWPSGGWRKVYTQ